MNVMKAYMGAAELNVALTFYWYHRSKTEEKNSSYDIINAAYQCVVHACLGPCYIIIKSQKYVTCIAAELY